MSVSRRIFPFVFLFVLLVVFGSYLSASETASSAPSKTVCCLVTSQPLNYSAYQITGSSGEITFLYSFPLTSGTGSLNMSAGLMTFFENATGDCGMSNCTGVGISCVNVNCRAISLTPSVSEISYYPSLKTTVTYKIQVVPNASLPSNYFILFPPAWQCRYALFLIFGNQIPTHAPVLIFTCPAIDIDNSPQPSVSVVGIQNITGLNLPT